MPSHRAPRFQQGPRGGQTLLVLWVGPDSVPKGAQRGRFGARFGPKENPRSPQDPSRMLPKRIAKSCSKGGHKRGMVLPGVAGARRRSNVTKVKFLHVFQSPSTPGSKATGHTVWGQIWCSLGPSFLGPSRALRAPRVQILWALLRQCDQIAMDLETELHVRSQG